MNKYWFGKKRIGWGVRPSSWEGWAAVVVFAAVLISAALCLLPREENLTFAVIFIIDLAVFIALCVAKYDGGEDKGE